MNDDLPLPDWITGSQSKPIEPSPSAPQAPTPEEIARSELALRRHKHELTIARYDTFFPLVMERMADGMSFEEVCQTITSQSQIIGPIQPAKYRRWILSDPKRAKEYEQAKILLAEQVEDDMIRIADGLNKDGTPSMDDINRSKLKVDTRRFMLQIWNREKYGDVKRVEAKATINSTTTTTVDLKQISTAELRQRVLRELGLTAEDGQFSPIDPIDPLDPLDPLGDPSDPFNPAP